MAGPRGARRRNNVCVSTHSLARQLVTSRQSIDVGRQSIACRFDDERERERELSKTGKEACECKVIKLPALLASLSRKTDPL